VNFNFRMDTICNCARFVRDQSNGFHLSAHGASSMGVSA
jgi:hypothetical protein